MEEYRDTNKKSGWLRNFNLAINFVELGKTYPLNQKDFSHLKYGIGEYLSKITGDGDFGGLGAALYYKDKIGVEVMFSTQTFSGQSNNFANYLVAKHPNHFIPNYTPSFNVDSWGPGFRICYRQHFKHFFIEPRLQFKPNNVSAFSRSFRLKEMGSNHFIQYQIDNVIHGRNDSYHLMLNVARKFDPFKEIAMIELGVLADFMIRPESRAITITEQPYGQAEVSNSESFRMTNAAISAKFSIKVFFGHASKK